MFIRLIEAELPLEHFDKLLWLEVIDCLWVKVVVTLCLNFQNGTEIEV